MSAFHLLILSAFTAIAESFLAWVSLSRPAYTNFHAPPETAIGFKELPGTIGIVQHPGRILNGGVRPAHELLAKTCIARDMDWRQGGTAGGRRPGG